MMDCKDCAESRDGEPGGACCAMCEERICYDEDPIIKVKPPGPRRALIREADAKAMCAKLAEALRVARKAMDFRSATCSACMPGHMEQWNAEDSVIESALKEWEDGK